MNSVKYPRTPHLPFSPRYSTDDEELVCLDGFRGQSIVVTEKMDGECTTLYSTHMHARSLNSRKHVSRDWMENYRAAIAHEMRADWRYCGENMYAKHSILYENLDAWFLGFNIWNEDNVALSWPETVVEFSRLSIPTVPVLYEGIFKLEILTQIANSIDTEKVEGFVVRLTDRIPYGIFGDCVAKWVRADHVQPEKSHWFNSATIRNKTKTGKWV